MDLKKKIKGFFTLTRNRTGGFTLVELIVVVAILAILAGVGIPAYSGYVKKANMQADMTLVNDIEHALTLAGYSGTFNEGEGGYIILSVDGIVNADEIAGSNLEKALIAAFGTGYADTLKLAYAGWNSSGLFDDLYGEMAMYVAQSSYMTGNRVDALLGDVEKMTQMAGSLVEVLSAGSGFLSNTTLSTMFSNADGCAIDATAAKYGITKSENETWEQWADKIPENKTAYSNLLVLTAADETEKSILTTGHENAYEMSGATGMILEFSSFYAFAATNPEFSAVLDTYLDQLNDGTTVTDASTGKIWYNSLKAEADHYGYSDSTKYTDEQKELDQLAFMSIMSGLGNPTDEQAANIATDLSNANLFTDGIINNMYNEYLDAVDVLDALYQANPNFENIDFGESEVAILVIQNDGFASITNSLPKQ